MDKVRLRVGDLVRKWRQSVLETVVVWDIHGWTKPKRAIESAIKKGIEEGRIQYTSVRNEK